jgi:hypothetical protein
LDLSPIDFAYEHFGRHVAPASKTAWLTQKGCLLQDSAKKKAGERSNGMAGTSIFIAESGVKVFGPDYREQGFPAVGSTKDATPFAFRMLFSMPQEPWMMVIFGNAATPHGMLRLNQPSGTTTTFVFHGGDKELMQANPVVLARVANVFRDAGVNAKAAAEALHLQREYMAGTLADDQSGKRLKKLISLRETVPKLPACANLLLDSGMPPHYVSKFIELDIA